MILTALRKKQKKKIKLRCCAFFPCERLCVFLANDSDANVGTNPRCFPTAPEVCHQSLLSAPQGPIFPG